MCFLSLEVSSAFAMIGLWCCDPLRMFSLSAHAWPQSPAHLISVNTTLQCMSAVLRLAWKGGLGHDTLSRQYLKEVWNPAWAGVNALWCDVEAGNQWDGRCCRLQSLENASVCADCREQTNGVYLMTRVVSSSSLCVYWQFAKQLCIYCHLLYWTGYICKPAWAWNNVANVKAD